MSGSTQFILAEESGSGFFATHSRISWIGSKIIQSTGLDEARADSVHKAMWLRILGSGTHVQNETDQLAAKIVAVATVAEKASAAGGSNAAMVAVMRESGASLDPLLAQNFLRVAASPVFWLALDAAGDARAS
jgi:hypothetical protein